MEKATFGAGCFWGVETDFRNIEGVNDAAVGYQGGATQDPTYKDVCYNNTGHAEVVEVDFDSALVSYEQLVRFFFEMHDPTQHNRQGPDIGDQYRSVIFTHSDEQAQIAQQVKESLDSSGAFKRPIATVIEPAPEFYRAEDYHQQYLAKRGQASCRI